MINKNILFVAFFLLLGYCTSLATIEKIRRRNSNEKENPDEISGFFEGDIVKNNKQRMTSNNTNLKWPSTVIPYTMDHSYDIDTMRVIESAISEIENNTCLTFARLNDTPTDQWPVDYLMFQDLSGCASSVGRQGGPQTISIQTPNCVFRGIVMHEILHSLGFLHEHNRPDRDNYIKVNWTNIEPEMTDHLQKYSEVDVNLFSEEYDYSSLLHGSSALFAIDPSYSTLIPIPDDTIVIGQRSYLSDSDIRRVKAFYCKVDPVTTTNTPETTTINIACNSTTQYIPDPTDCSRFYVCTNNYPQLHTCPPNLVFNPTLNVCDWTWNVNCTSVY